MFCPFCNFNETVVKDSRISDDGRATRRRRYCPNCDSRFTTYERIQLKEIIVVKRSGEKEFFDAEKLKRSLRMALRKREAGAFVIDKIVSDIYNNISSSNESEITSQKIGEQILAILKKLDSVAFVRFASVYKNFNSTEDFKNFIKFEV